MQTNVFLVIVLFYDVSMNWSQFIKSFSWRGSPALASVLLLLFSLPMIAEPAYARLGGTEAELPLESASLGLDVRAHVEATSHYRIHSYASSLQGIQIRQYAGPDGRIFFVSWDGPVKPDLSRLLGSYFVHYLRAASAVSQVRGFRQINHADFVLRLGGHMRHLQGQAWVPALLPVDMIPSELR